MQVDGSGHVKVRLRCISVALPEAGVGDSSSEMSVQLSTTFASLRTERLFAHNMTVFRFLLEIQYSPYLPSCTLL